MTSNRLSKVAKHIAKKKGGKKALHENSRDTQRLQRAGALDEKLNKLAGVRKRQNQPYLARIEFFQTAADEHTSIFALPDIQLLIQQYIHRDDEELETLKAERRPGRPASTREDLLKQKQDAETGEYKSGFWVPDLEDALNLQVLKEWDGRWASLHKVKFVRIAIDGTKKESSFPPKGLS